MENKKRNNEKRDRNQYCVFALYVEENIIKYRAIFPFAIDQIDATIKSKRYLKKIGLSHSKTRCVGPVIINDLPKVVLDYDIAVVNDFDGHIHTEVFTFLL